MNHEGSSFISGCAPLGAFAFFAKQADELAEQGQRNSSFFMFYEGYPETPYSKYARNVGWTAQAMATVKNGERREVVAVGDDGDYWELDPSGPTDQVGRIDVVRGTVRSLTVVEGQVYGCGMGRMALHREAPGRWREFGPPDSSESPVIGFEDIDGFSAGEMYAVGWNGEIWAYIERQWHRIDSPVSAILSAVCCGDDGVVYAVGHGGTMLKGRGDNWEIVETGRAENLLDVQVFEGRVYVVSNFDIFTLTEHGLALDTEFGDDDRPSTCLHLLRASDALMSMGTKDFWRKQKGQWERLV